MAPIEATTHLSVNSQVRLCWCFSLPPTNRVYRSLMCGKTYIINDLARLDLYVCAPIEWVDTSFMLICASMFCLDASHRASLCCVGELTCPALVAVY